MKNSWVHGLWAVECCPEDGGRITRLQYAGNDLLTVPPENFSPPVRDQGLYETRPVYGYDDCFPTVDACRFPGRGWAVPDHGELCWLPWTVAWDEGRLVCSTESRELPVTFSRELLFGEKSLQWKFSVHNRGATSLPFLHVMHALFPLDQVQAVSLPDAGSIYDEMRSADFNEPGKSDLAEYLRTVPAGRAQMLLLRDIQIGQLSVLFKHGIRLHLSWSSASFPTLGIWWNNRGYPEGKGGQRSECAFEPIAGPGSSLEHAFNAGQVQCVDAESSTEWMMDWRIELYARSMFPGKRRDVGQNDRILFPMPDFD